jgi:pimeloyl-ACP methyl ester carboxylesterase
MPRGTGTHAGIQKYGLQHASRFALWAITTALKKIIMEHAQITPFAIHIEDSALADLRRRLAATRWPDELAAEPWAYGADLAALRRMTDYWRETFDWRAAEAAINRLAQFTTEIDGIRIHFIHERGNGPAPMPVIISHGWPGSFVEMLDIIPLLADPARHGGDAADAFDVIVPSLPGYGFSGRPAAPGMTPLAMAEIFALLMARLGYAAYGVQGGDWGATISTWLARRYPGRVTAIHLNWIPGAYQPPMGGGAPPFSEAEKAFQARMVAQASSGVSTHTGIHASRPQTLGYALNDSPAGLAAWLIDKFRMIADCGGDIESAITLDRLLTNVSVYWFTETITSAIRLYKEAQATPLKFMPGERITPPLGFASFPGEVASPPRAWVDRVYNVRRWTEMQRGGHFAAMEQPQALAEDIRAFFRPYR